jgi:hypothetical protein
VSRTPNPWRPITAISAVVIAACTLYFFLYVALIAPRFLAMFADLGSGGLPLATQIAVKPAITFIALFFLAAGTVAGVLRPVERPLIWSLTAGTGMLLCFTTLGVLYLPLIMLAGQIK